jgi:hypothetical protein
VNLLNRQVRFQVRDVYYPNSTELLAHLHGKESLQGEVRALSDSGSKKDVFVVVKVDGIEQEIVVAADKVSCVP